MKKSLTLLSLACWVLSCTYDEVAVRNSDVIRSLTIKDSSLPADAASGTEVTAELPINADADKRTVEFVTTKGTFAGTDGKSIVSVIAMQDELTTPFRLLAKATLISPQTAGTAIVTARTAGYAQQKMFSFETAPPNELTIMPNQLVLKQGADNELTLTIMLKRKQGIPSIGQSISISTTKADGKTTVGRLRGDVSLSDASGKCQAFYTLGEDKYIGQVLIQAKIGDLVSKIETIYTY